MSINHAAIAEAYYRAVGEKRVDEIEKHLHPDVRFIGPLAKMTGKEAVIDATKKFTAFFQSLKIRGTFGSGDQVMVVYDLECPAPVGKLSTAVLMTFEDGLVAKIELFYDARPFEKKEENVGSFHGNN